WQMRRFPSEEFERFDTNLPIFMVEYADGSRELRRIDDGSVIPTPDKPTNASYPGKEKTGLFVVKYAKALPELWCPLPPFRVLTLPTAETSVSFHERSSFFLISGKGEGELRRRDDASLVQKLTY